MVIGNNVVISYIDIKINRVENSSLALNELSRNRLNCTSRAAMQNFMKVKVTVQTILAPTKFALI
jgi:hypothetical protein